MVLRVDQLAQFRLDRPILLRLERPNLALAFHHQPHRDGLHPPGAQSARDPLVQQRRNLVAHDAVEDSPRLLGIDQLHVHLAGVVERRPHGVLGNFIELHAEKLRAVLLALQNLLQMPGDRFAFAIRVGRQIDLLGALGGLFEIVVGENSKQILSFRYSSN